MKFSEIGSKIRKLPNENYGMNASKMVDFEQNLKGWISKSILGIFT